MKRYSKSITLLYAIMLIVSCNKNAAKLYFSPSKVEKITITNGGLIYDYKTRIVTDRDSINALCKLINGTTLLDSDTIQLRRSSVSLWVNIYMRPDDVIKMKLKDTFESGSVIWYDGSTYKANELYNYIKQSNSQK